MFYAAAASLLIAGIIILVLAGKMRDGMNISHLAGVRTKHTMTSDEVFSRSNQRVWKGTFVTGILLLLMAAICIYHELNPLPEALFLTAILGLNAIVLIIAFWQVVTANRIAKEMNARNSAANNLS
ncbi:MAG: SdpI family protein [Flaviflexus sp.]|nr:SdpI family protein [Flaviflexus sp.]